MMTDPTISAGHPEPPSAWYADWFNTTYLKIYAHRDREQAGKEVEFLIRSLGLKPHHRILDLGCGAGRHLRWFRELGFDRSTGMDLSSELLTKASEDALLKEVLVRGDMRSFPFMGCFDAVLSLFTSFGYFQSDTENLKVLKNIRTALVPGGRFLLDLISYRVAERLVPETRREVDDMQVVERRQYNRKTRRIEKEIHVQSPAEDRTWYESVRVYSFGEIRCLLAEANLCMADVRGDFEGQRFDLGSERMIVMGKASLATDRLESANGI